ncbi:putative metabolite transport protein HI_1104 isoform X1 [Neodiprion virginianus]|uniref:putative metabolite transport protein HI_1104 isoform X2 n=1 Tax=Neodiprion fabricii TaxID=2872261 RepID=UPI001ED8C8C0|nr:putative metabolite transport protein HI_1104 isoform X2 [Neodiprion fabricii]XP_046611487.1 putative metabolite transport protein HI_1104 isoform X1 [Neodiprion virginianus]
MGCVKLPGRMIISEPKATMFSTVLQKFKFLYKPYALAIVSLGYVLGELGHYMIGVTSKATAIDLHYGDISCQLNSTEYSLTDLPVQCESANNTEYCLSLDLNGTNYCEWNYNGLGLDYQILAGPSFIAVFTVVGVILGVAADRFNRIKMLAICTLIFSVAIILMGAVKEYWQLVLLRMVLAAGEAACNPMATGLLSDWFDEDQRGLVMSVFNWGIYGGYGIAFPIGRYVPEMNAWDLGWRVCYYGAGIVGVIIAILTGFTLKEPERTAIGEESAASGKKVSLWKVILQPRIVLLCLAASIRHCGGMCFAYNCDLYYRDYFPDYDLGWWLFAVTIVVGSIGVVVGGVVSDKFVAKMGIRSRVAVLAISQLVATPFAFGSVYFDPLWAIITLGISYFFAEMWFGIVFAILVEIVPLSLRSTTVGIFLFVMNNIGGNLPILVEPLRKMIGFRESLYILYAGFYGISSIMFLLTTLVMGGPTAKGEKDISENGVDNTTFTNDDGRLSTLELPRLPARPHSHENSRL